MKLNKKKPRRASALNADALRAVLGHSALYSASTRSNNGSTSSW